MRGAFIKIKQLNFVTNLKINKKISARFLKLHNFCFNNVKKKLKQIQLKFGLPFLTKTKKRPAYNCRSFNLKYLWIFS